MFGLGIAEAIVIVGLIFAVVIVWAVRKVLSSQASRSSNFANLPPDTWVVDGQVRQDLGPETKPVAPSGIYVEDDTELWPGMRVLVNWQNQWLNAEIVSLASTDDVVVHYVGWDASWDERVPRSRMQLTR